MLSQINAKFQVRATRSPASQGDITSLRVNFTSVPDEYIKLVREATEIELSFVNKNNRKRYIRIWGPDGCLEFSEAYMIVQRIPEAIPIGDDGSGSCFLYMNGNQGWGLYLSDLSVIDREDAKWIAPTLRELLVDGIGADAF